jgi:hypothetical protein
VAPPNVERQLARTLRELEREGLLLETDAELPSLVSTVAGGPVRGSWWGHPLGHTIFATGEALFSHPDVLLAKLVSGKDTWIHRRLWSALFAVARAREPWQTAGLSRGAASLLERVDREGEARASGEIAREIERRLLARGEQAHTASGRHGKLLESWERWGKRVSVPAPIPSPEEGRRQLEEVLAALNRRYDGRGRLPWQRPPRGRAAASG